MNNKCITEQIVGAVKRYDKIISNVLWQLHNKSRTLKKYLSKQKYKKKLAKDVFVGCIN